MKIKKYLQMMLLAAIMFNVSCTDNFDELNDNPNATTQVPASMIATQMLEFVKYSKTTMQNSVYTSQILPQAIAIEIDLRHNNEFGEVGFGVYDVMRNFEQLIASSDEASLDTYMGLGLFCKTFQLFQLSASLGDIPYSEAGQGEAGLLTPKYDTQKEVMRQIIADLDAAYDYFNKATIVVNGDFTDLNGDVNKWKRIVNLSELRVLINLSKKESDADLNIKAKFAEVAGRPLVESNNDNLKLSFKDASNMWAPGHPMRGYYFGYAFMTDFLVDMLKKYDDYRLFYFAEPAKEATDNGLSADDWNAYAGVNLCLTKDDITPLLASGQISRQNIRYSTAVAEPLSRLGYTQQCFILAEGALRGWLPGKTAEEYYNKGIEAGMKFTRDATAALGNPDYYHGREMTDAYIAAHLNLPAVKLTGNFASDLEKILEQKYIACYMQYTSIYEQYFDYRRTGYPKLPLDPSTNMNTMPDRFPARWTYSTNERNTNLENLEEAINRQYPSKGDDVNELMWILK